MFITPLLIVGAIRVSRPHAPWARWRYAAAAAQDAPMRWSGSGGCAAPSCRPSCGCSTSIAGEPHFPDDPEVNEQLDTEIHAAPAPAPTRRQEAA